MQKHLILACDMPLLIALVYCSLLQDGSESPIGFASQTLPLAEHKYSQI